MKQSCFQPALRSIVHNRCMIRSNYTRVEGFREMQLPIYVTHAPFLRTRHAYMEAQLKVLQTADVTWIECFNRDDVLALSAAARDCLYPCSTIPHKDGHPSPEFMSNGTFSLAIKHRLAALDILRRSLSAAIVLEDDAALPNDLWRALATVRLPIDAGLFYLGSYSFRSNVGTLGFANGAGCHTPVSQHGMPLMPHVGHISAPMVVWKRNFTCFPTMLGNTAFVLTARGARTHIHGPVTVPADIGLSHWPERRDGRQFSCTAPDGTVATQDWSVPQAAYAPGKWIVWPGTMGPPASALPSEMRSMFSAGVLKGGTHMLTGIVDPGGVGNKPADKRPAVNGEYKATHLTMYKHG
mgnify:CR=1 FL=1